MHAAFSLKGSSFICAKPANAPIQYCSYCSQGRRVGNLKRKKLRFLVKFSVRVVCFRWNLEVSPELAQKYGNGKTTHLLNFDICAVRNTDALSNSTSVEFYFYTFTFLSNRIIYEKFKSHIWWKSHVFIDW
ncbi:hypothetical protein L596_001493 [Steinernema carpocapsae]|uniref:Uncharacterized protein n=1 Tax=Steinernema carpocapsae TaxID=34508 RepID=A0A4U8ULQ4_STECR|nr:hypothetical protein L596_001493 [Steinernema carpocapsae]